MESQKSNHKASTAVLKRQWRRQLKQICQSLDSRRQEEAAQSACKQLAVLSESVRFVLSIPSFNHEINLWPFNQKLATTGQLVLPRIIEKKLQLFHVTHLNDLEMHPWGILEPKISDYSILDSSSIEIALIPGLGFDLETKHRLGYGWGYYDRLIPTLVNAKIWGIGFLEQAVKKLPYTEEDVSLEEIYLF